MAQRRRIGLPTMHKEKGERRVFLPAFVSFLDRVGADEIVLEHGYGQSVGLNEKDYTDASAKVRFAPLEECYAQDLVTVLRCPDDRLLKMMKRDAVLVSMLHYPTRPNRVAMLRELGIRGVSLDSIKDDLGRRLVEYLQAVGWNGVRVGFQELTRSLRRFADPGRRPIRVTIMGGGAVGTHAAQAATRYGDVKVRDKMIAAGVPGVEVTIIDYDLTSGENYMLSRLEMTDLLVDATLRRDASRYVIPNDWVEALPHHAVIVDLSVDPYDFTTNPRTVKGIEGVPEGNLDQYVFHPDDPVYDRLDTRVQTTHRRIAASCYSWPGVEPKECMDVYGKQMEPVMRVLLDRELDSIDTQHGTYYERAVARADLHRWTEG